MSDTLMAVFTEETDDIMEDTDTTLATTPVKAKRQKKAMTVHGFREGSDSAIIVAILVQGGLDRQEINEKIAASINPVTRSGRAKNIPSLVSGLLSRLESRGYLIDSHWRVVAPSK